MSRGPQHACPLLAAVLGLGCGNESPPEPSAEDGVVATEGGDSSASTTTSTSPATGSTTASDGSQDTTEGTTFATAADETTADPTTGSTGPSETDGSSSGDPLDGLGAISGDCGTIDMAAIESTEPGFVVNAIDFARTGFDYDLLTQGGQEVFDDGNLGGNSLLSEVIAFDVLARCEAAVLTKTETEIVYTDPMGLKTDLLVELAGHPVGVSVTRAIAFPFEDPYGVEHASVLLTDKLEGVIASSANVAPKDAWTKQILHVIAYGPMHAESLQQAYAELPAELMADTLVVVTVTNGDDGFLYE